MVRPEVAWFTEKMEEELRKNEHKGGWKDEGFSWLLDQLVKNVTELWTVTSPEERLAKAVDVGNRAMMIADIYRKEAEERASRDY